MKRFFYILIFTFSLCDMYGQTIAFPERLEKCHTATDGTQTSYVEYRTVYNSNKSQTFEILCEDASGNKIPCPTTGTISWGWCNVPTSEQCWVVESNDEYCVYDYAGYTYATQITNIGPFFAFRTRNHIDTFLVNGVFAPLPNYPYRLSSSTDSTFNADITTYLQGQGYDALFSTNGSVNVKNSDLTFSYSGDRYQHEWTGAVFADSVYQGPFEYNYTLTNDCSSAMTYTWFDVCVDKRTGDIIVALDTANNVVTLPANAYKAHCPIMPAEPEPVCKNSNLEFSQVVQNEIFTLTTDTYHSITVQVIVDTVIVTEPALQGGNSVLQLICQTKRNYKASDPCEYIQFTKDVTIDATNGTAIIFVKK